MGNDSANNRLGASVDNGLPPEMRAQIDVRLRTCIQCQADLGAHQTASSILQALSLPPQHSEQFKPIWTDRDSCRQDRFEIHP